MVFKIGAILGQKPTLHSFTLAGLCALLSPAAQACPYEEAAAAAESGNTAHVDEVAAAHTAIAPTLMGANCAYSTGLMARRVIGEGRDWTYVGGLRAGPNDLGSRVAAPYQTVGGDSAGLLVATELLERLVAAGQTGATYSLSGRSLKIDGVTYVVLTSYRVITS